MSKSAAEAQAQLFDATPLPKKRARGTLRLKTPLEELKYREIQKRQAVLAERLDQWIDRVAENKEKLAAHMRNVAKQSQEE